MDRQKKLNTKPDGPARSWRVAGSGCPGCHTETYQAGGQRMPQDLNMLMPQDLNMLIKLKHITKRDDYETPNLYIGAPRHIPLVVVQLG